jgi:hypothetical protein
MGFGVYGRRQRVRVAPPGRQGGGRVSRLNGTPCTRGPSSQGLRRPSEYVLPMLGRARQQGAGDGRPQQPHRGRGRVLARLHDPTPDAGPHPHLTLARTGRRRIAKGSAPLAEMARQLACLDQQCRGGGSHCRYSCGVGPGAYGVDRPGAESLKRGLVHAQIGDSGECRLLFHVRVGHASPLSRRGRLICGAVCWNARLASRPRRRGRPGWAELADPKYCRSCWRDRAASGSLESSRHQEQSRKCSCSGRAGCRRTVRAARIPRQVPPLTAERSTRPVAPGEALRLASPIRAHLQLRGYRRSMAI